VTTCVLLLRGINVGRNKRIAMGDLRSMLAGAGYGDVRTHLQSGNVVLDTGRPATEVGADVHRRIAETFGHDVAVVVRTAPELQDVVRRSPLAEPPDGSRFLVSFLSGVPDPDGVAGLLARAAEVEPERHWCLGREVYSWYPDGLLESRIDFQLWGRLGTTATARNWNTVTRLAAMAAG
jgi:uncharacterized protein (DUF1697 family)